MLMRVVYTSGKYDFVNGKALTRLIKSKEIVRFKRFDGWVDIDSPKVRENGKFTLRYIGEEKRGESINA